MWHRTLIKMHLDWSYCPFRVGQMKATLLMHLNWLSILPGVVTAGLTRSRLRDKRTVTQVSNTPLFVSQICSLVWSWISRVPLLGSLVPFWKLPPGTRSQYIVVWKTNFTYLLSWAIGYKGKLVFFYSQLLDLSFTGDLYRFYNIEEYWIRNQCTETVQIHL